MRNAFPYTCNDIIMNCYYTNDSQMNYSILLRTSLWLKKHRYHLLYSKYVSFVYQRHRRFMPNMFFIIYFFKFDFNVSTRMSHVRYGTMMTSWHWYIFHSNGPLCVQSTDIGVSNSRGTKLDKILWTVSRSTIVSEYPVAPFIWHGGCRKSFCFNFLTDYSNATMSIL